DQAASTAGHDLALGAKNLAATYRADLGHDNHPRVRRATFCDNTEHFRNHIPGAIDHHTVADAQVAPGNFVHVMQRGVADGDAADLHRLQSCHRRDRAGATNLPLHITQYGDFFLRRTLVCDGPTRCTRNKPELFLPVKAIDPVDHAVDVIAELVAPRQDILVERLQRLDTGATFYFA